MTTWLTRWPDVPPSPCCDELAQCRRELEACRSLLRSNELHRLRAACEALQSDLAACQKEKERLQWQLGYREREIERLQSLVAEQQNIIARQQARLADLMPEG